VDHQEYWFEKDMIFILSDLVMKLTHCIAEE
jgi:hypothetical protein